MTPKSLLRNPLAASPLSTFTEGKFRDVYEEQYDNIKPNKVDRIVMCSGKVFYELLTRRQDDQINNVAILRLEQLYPFPTELLKTEIAKYKNAKELVWCQEEPINQVLGILQDTTLWTVLIKIKPLMWSRATFILHRQRAVLGNITLTRAISSSKLLVFNL
jgi:2-oxoglutarate dehydrogenase complex dehydrogenase (E1) component-like enzyme